MGRLANRPYLWKSMILVYLDTLPNDLAPVPFPHGKGNVSRYTRNFMGCSDEFNLLPCAICVL